MTDLDYCKPSKDEWFDLLFITFSLSFLFSFTFSIYDARYDFLEVWFSFFIFITLLFITRLYFMKFLALRNAFEMEFSMSYFDRYWFAKYDRLSEVKEISDKYVGSLMNKNMEDHTYVSKGKIKGIPLAIFTILIYVITLGSLIYPSLWKHKIKKIPHLHIGTQQYFESTGSIYFNIEISDYRYSKVLMGGFFFYFIFGLLMKFLMFETILYFWYVFILYWIALFTIVPIPGNEGFELFRKNTFGWITIFTILVLGMVALFVFDDFWYMILITVFSSVAILFTILWRRIMK